MRGVTRSVDRGTGLEHNRSFFARLALATLAVCAAIALAVGLRALQPKLLALYHQEQGVRLLARALSVEKDALERDEGNWLIPETLARGEAQALAAQALEHFRAAAEADASNAHVHRWLGRTALLLGRPEDAIVAFSRAVHLRPKHPLAWWELGLAYESLAPVSTFPWVEQEAMPRSIKGAFLVDNTQPKLVLIPATSVEAPLSVASTPVKHDTWARPDAPAVWSDWWVPSEPISRNVLFVGAPTTLTFQLSLPVTPTSLVFWMAADLHLASREPVSYNVWVNGEKVLSLSMQHEDLRRGWWPAQVDLGMWSGRTISLGLSVDFNSSEGNSQVVGWGDLQLVSTASARCQLASCWARAEAAWKEGGFTAQDFTWAEEEARRAQRYGEAMAWYKRKYLLKSEHLDTFPTDFRDQSLLILESFAALKSWRPCPWCNNTPEGHIGVSNGFLEMSYQNLVNERQGLALLSYPQVLLDGSRYLLLRIKGDPGTLLTLEVVVDGTRSRPLNYKPVPGEWDVWSIPLEGRKLEEILISIGEPEPLADATEYRVFVDWIALR